MSGPWGYQGYRGPSKKRKWITAALSLLLVFLLLLLFVQQNVVYEADGSLAIRWPWSQEREEKPLEETEVNLVKDPARPKPPAAEEGPGDGAPDPSEGREEAPGG